MTGAGRRGAAALSAPEVTVAVPVKDRHVQMLRCVDALLAQDHPSFEILVLDNESSDGTPDAVREHVREAKVPVRIEVVPGTVGHVRNRAARLARGEFLAFTDSDCLPDPGWLTAATAALRADAGLGAVQGRTLPEVPIDRPWPATIHVERFTGHYESCNLVFRRAAFAASDGFDETVGHFWEDTAAGYALKRAGWYTTYVPEALVYHDVTYPGFRWHLQRMQRNRNLAPVLARYPEMRQDMLFWRVFLRKRDAKFVGAIAALALAPRHRAALALALPYAQFLLTEDTGRPVHGWWHPRRVTQGVLYDAARVTGLLRGGLRNGRIVL